MRKTDFSETNNEISQKVSSFSICSMHVVQYYDVESACAMEKAKNTFNCIGFFTPLEKQFLEMLISL